MARGRQYPDDIKEKAYYLYAVCGNVSAVARHLGVPGTTVEGWIKNMPDKDGFEALRAIKKAEFIEKSSEIMDLALARLKEKLDSGASRQINHLATVIGTLYDKQALAAGDSTQNTSVTVTLPEGAEEFAE